MYINRVCVCITVCVRVNAVSQCEYHAHGVNAVCVSVNYLSTARQQDNYFLPEMVSHFREGNAGAFEGNP